MNRDDINALSIKELNEFINEFGIVKKNCVEKQDLVNLILGSKHLDFDIYMMHFNARIAKNVPLKVYNAKEEHERTENNDHTQPELDNPILNMFTNLSHIHDQDIKASADKMKKMFEKEFINEGASSAQPNSHQHTGSYSYTSGPGFDSFSTDAHASGSNTPIVVPQPPAYEPPTQPNSFTSGPGFESFSTGRQTRSDTLPSQPQTNTNTSTDIPITPNRGSNDNSAWASASVSGSGSNTPTQHDTSGPQHIPTPQPSTEQSRLPQQMKPDFHDRSATSTPFVHPPSLINIMANKTDPKQFTPKQLKFILKRENVSLQGLLEKRDLVDRVNLLIQNIRGDLAQADNDEMMCRICCEQVIDCVLIECGHVVACLSCAVLIF
jgi:hypothetical protein